MTAFYFLLLVLASICFLAATFNANLRNLNLVSLGLLFWIAVPAIETYKNL
jgi:hypothetical protein